jgi:hypothetical protein
MDTSVDHSFEAVPRYARLPRAVLRERLRSAALSILAAGQRVSVQRLREHGVRGGTAALIALREELVATRKLPLEAGARLYTHCPHRNGQASPPPVDVGLRHVDDKPRPSRVQRRIRRLIREYDSAVRRIFGAQRATQIGAVSPGRKPRRGA